ncbi:hypothetical protein HQ560_12665 [bacterium]|nr:hypothetical protein [bacterium]
MLTQCGACRSVVRVPEAPGTPLVARSTTGRTSLWRRWLRGMAAAASPRRKAT